MASPEVFDPLTRYQCCPPTCGAAAAVLCSDEFARKHNIAPDTAQDDVRGLMNDSRDHIKDLGDKAAGADWDKSFLDDEIDGHQKVLDKLQDAAKNTTNADLRAMLVKASGKVQEHLTKARALKEKYPA